MSHSGNILFLGGDDSQRKAIQTALKQACAGHEHWTLEEKVEKIRLTLSFNGACVCSFVFRPLPENADDCRKAVVGACGVFLLCQVGPSGEPSQSVSQALEALRQDPASPTVYPLLLLGANPTQMERALLKWGGMGLSLGGSPDAPYGMNALLARCLPWMAMGEAQSLLTVEEVETLWADYCRYGTLKVLNRLTLRLKEEGPLSPLDYAWFLPQGTHAVLSGDARVDLKKLLSFLPKSGCGALTVAALKQYIARLDRLELNTFQVREWRTAFTMALKDGNFEKEKHVLPTRVEGQSPTTTASSGAKERDAEKSSLFSFEGRMGPSAWFGANFVMGLIGLALIVALFVLGERMENPEAVKLLAVYVMPLAGLWIWGICATSVRRLHDMGAPGALILPEAVALVASLIEVCVLLFAADDTVVAVESGWSRMSSFVVAVVGFIVMMMPGDPKENKYGAPPA